MCFKLMIHDTNCETRQPVHLQRIPNSDIPQFDIYHPFEEPGKCEHSMDQETVSVREHWPCAQHGSCCQIYTDDVCDQMVHKGYFSCMGFEQEAHFFRTDKVLEGRIALDFCDFAQRANAKPIRNAQEVFARLKHYLDVGTEVHGLLSHLDVKCPQDDDTFTTEVLEAASDDLSKRWKDACSTWFDASLGFWDGKISILNENEQQLCHQRGITPYWMEAFRIPPSAPEGESKEGSNIDDDDDDDDGDNNARDTSLLEFDDDSYDEQAQKQYDECMASGSSQPIFTAGFTETPQRYNQIRLKITSKSKKKNLEDTHEDAIPKAANEDVDPEDLEHETDYPEDPEENETDGDLHSTGYYANGDQDYYASEREYYEDMDYYVDEKDHFENRYEHEDSDLETIPENSVKYDGKHTENQQVTTQQSTVNDGEPQVAPSEAREAAARDFEPEDQDDPSPGPLVASGGDGRDPPGGDDPNSGSQHDDGDEDEDSDESDSNSDSDSDVEDGDDENGNSGPLGSDPNNTNEEDSQADTEASTQIQDPVEETVEENDGNNSSDKENEDPDDHLNVDEQSAPDLPPPPPPPMLDGIPAQPPPAQGPTPMADGYGPYQPQDPGAGASRLPTPPPDTHGHPPAVHGNVHVPVPDGFIPDGINNGDDDVDDDDARGPVDDFNLTEPTLYQGRSRQPGSFISVASTSSADVDAEDENEDDNAEEEEDNNTQEDEDEDVEENKEFEEDEDLEENEDPEEGGENQDEQDRDDNNEDEGDYADEYASYTYYVSDHEEDTEDDGRPRYYPTYAIFRENITWRPINWAGGSSQNPSSAANEIIPSPTNTRSRDIFTNEWDGVEDTPAWYYGTTSNSSRRRTWPPVTTRTADPADHIHPGQFPDDESEAEQSAVATRNATSVDGIGPTILPGGERRNAIIPDYDDTIDLLGCESEPEEDEDSQEPEPRVVTTRNATSEDYNDPDNLPDYESEPEQSGDPLRSAPRIAPMVVHDLIGPIDPNYDIMEDDEYLDVLTPQHPPYRTHSPSDDTTSSNSSLYTTPETTPMVDGILPLDHNTYTVYVPVLQMPESPKVRSLKRKARKEDHDDKWPSLRFRAEKKMKVDGEFKIKGLAGAVPYFHASSSSSVGRSSSLSYVVSTDGESESRGTKRKANGGAEDSAGVESEEEDSDGERPLSPPPREWKMRRLSTELRKMGSSVPGKKRRFY